MHNFLVEAHKRHVKHKYFKLIMGQMFQHRKLVLASMLHINITLLDAW